jgi:hypothetical protein
MPKVANTNTLSLTSNMLEVDPAISHYSPMLNQSCYLFLSSPSQTLPKDAAHHKAAIMTWLARDRQYGSTSTTKRVSDNGSITSEDCYLPTGTASHLPHGRTLTPALPTALVEAMATTIAAPGKSLFEMDMVKADRAVKANMKSSGRDGHGKRRAGPSGRRRRGLGGRIDGARAKSTQSSCPRPC